MIRTSRKALGAWLVLATLPAAAQDQPSKPPSQAPQEQRDPKVEDWKPATLPADALAYGAALEENAPPKVKKWSTDYAHKEMPNQKIDPRATMAVVDKEFPKASDEARDAVIFLLDYLAYKHQDNEQLMLAARIRRIDNDAYDITRRMIILKENQESGMSSTSKNRAISPQQALRVEEELRNLEQQLRTMGEDRKLKMAQLETMRKRVNGYLKVMAVTYPRMNGIEATILRTMQ